jgi:Calcium binding
MARSRTTAKKFHVEDDERENRIAYDIVVDAYGEDERAMGWYYYLQDTLSFPFKACCTESRSISVLDEGETVTVLEMAEEEDCMEEIFVLVQWKKKQVAVPLAQLQGIGVDEDTQQAIDDWHYWLDRGHEF